MNIITVHSTEILSKYFGETESSLRTLFATARKSSPCMLFFDEFDAISCKRSMEGGGSSGGNLNARILSTFLNEMDGVTSENQSKDSESNVIIVVACQDISKLDDALVRPGRLHHHIHLENPNEDDIEDLLNYKLSISPYEEQENNILSGIPCAPDVDISKLTSYLFEKNSSCADVVGLCKAASYNAIRRHVNANLGENSENKNKIFVQWSDFESLIE